LKEEPFNTLVLSNEANQTGVAIEAVEDDTELVIVSSFRVLYRISLSEFFCRLLANLWTRLSFNTAPLVRILYYIPLLSRVLTFASSDDYQRRNSKDFDGL